MYGASITGIFTAGCPLGICKHLIVLNNVFGADACATLLLYKIQEEYWSALKSFLLFLNILREDELAHIDKDEGVYNILKEL